MRPMNRISRLSGVTALTAALILTFACSRKHSANSKAILLSDKAVSLLPGRLLASPSSDPAYENSIRMMMLPVSCKTGGEIRKLEELSAADPEVIRRNGRNIVGQDGKAIAGAESCEVLGNFAVHPWSYSRLFEANPRSREEFANQQWVWLALRGRTTDSNKTFTRGFERWMAEGGIYRSMPVFVTQTRMASLDAIYNPCVAQTSNLVRFDKRENFRCIDGDYAPAFDKLGNSLSWMIEQSAVELLSAIRAGQFSAYNTTGVENALIIDPQALKSALSPKFALDGAGSDKTSKMETAKAGGLISGLVDLIIVRNRNKYTYGGSGNSRFNSYNNGPLQMAGYGGFGTPSSPVAGKRNGRYYVNRPQTSMSARPPSASDVLIPDDAQLIQYPGENHAYYRTNATQDWKDKMYALYGDEYAGTEKLVGTNGEILYVDRFKDGRNDWYKEVDGKLIATHSTVGTTNVTDRSDLQRDQTINGVKYKVIDNTKFNQAQFDDQSGVTSTFYHNEKNPELSFYVDRQADGTYRGYHRDGSAMGEVGGRFKTSEEHQREILERVRQQISSRSEAPTDSKPKGGFYDQQPQQPPNASGSIYDQPDYSSGTSLLPGGSPFAGGSMSNEPVNDGSGDDMGDGDHGLVP